MLKRYCIVAIGFFFFFFFFFFDDASNLRTKKTAPTGR